MLGIAGTSGDTREWVLSPGRDPDAVDSGFGAVIQLLPLAKQVILSQHRAHKNAGIRIGDEVEVPLNDESAFRQTPDRAHLHGESCQPVIHHEPEHPAE